MRVLLTNDDGIDSQGLHVLARALGEIAEVVVVAPDREYSGASAAVGALHELRPEARRSQVDGATTAWSLNGPPALCVMFARLGAFGDPFNLVVAGVNPGANVGRAIYHSGTVGAALTARNGGLSGVAVSQAVAGLGVEGQGWDEMLHGMHWETAVHVGASFVSALLADMPTAPVVANINVPNVAIGALLGWRQTDVGVEPPRRMSTAELVPMIGHPNAYDIRMEWGPLEELPPGSDGRCVEDGYVSLSYVTRLASEDRPDLRDVEAAFLAR